MGAIINLDKDNFKKETASGVVLIDFWAPWCGPCRAIAPTLDTLAKEYGDKVSITKVNTDDHPELAQQFEVMGIPALFILKDGEIVDQYAGAQPINVLQDALNKNL